MTNDEFIARFIVRELVRGLVANGCRVRLFSDGDPLTDETTDPFTISDEIGATDSVSLRVFRRGERLGSVLLIEGNGCDVISDGSQRLWDEFPDVFEAIERCAEELA